jgi:hypothetical protein
MILSNEFIFNDENFEPQNDCVIKSGPTVIKMGRGQMGKEWVVKRDVYCFKITIEDTHRNTIEEAMEAVSRLPILYLVGLEIVSDENENGLALYKDLGGAAGHGGRTYCNLIGLNLGVIIHELGHGIEQEVRLSAESDLLDRWEKEAKNVDSVTVSGYGNQNPWEDMAEFCKVYAVCLQTNKLEELKERSPNRFRIWEHCMKLVNSTLRNKKCADSEDVPLKPELPVQDGSAEETLVTPPDEYEPDSPEVEVTSKSSNYSYVIFLVLLVILGLVLFFFILNLLFSKHSTVRVRVNPRAD